MWSSARIKRVWAPSADPAELYQVVEVCDESPDAAGKIGVRSGSKSWRVRPEETWPLDPTHEDDHVDDVSDLHNLHAAPLLATLRRRWKQGSIYTKAGPVLLAVRSFSVVGRWW